MARTLRLWWQNKGKTGGLLLKGIVRGISSLIIGVIALIPAIGLYIKGWTIKSVLSNLQIRPLENPISDGK